jgi:hypothetical protein
VFRYVSVPFTFSVNLKAWTFWDYSEKLKQY